MKEAIGGVLSLNLILIFLVIISCYLAFSVNYTKAFRIKNEIRSIIEKHEGLTCEALKKINELFEKTNYEGFPGQNCPEGFLPVQLTKGSFCLKVQQVGLGGSEADNATNKGAYYTVATYVNLMHLPLLNGMGAGTNDLMNFLMQPFIVKGETAIIYSSGVNSVSNIPTSISGCSEINGG